MNNIKKELVRIMEEYPSRDSDTRYVFVDREGVPKAYPRRLGEYLHTRGGTQAMSQVMNDLHEIVQKKMNAGEDWYVFDLRQLEFCWNGVGEWSA